MEIQLVGRDKNISPEAEAYLNSRIPQLEVGEFLIKEGDLITVALPTGGDQRANRQVEFVAHVVHEDKAPYVEVREKDKGDNGLTRCIRVEDIKKVGRKKV